ncbi:Solute carrier organic anion transporter family member 5A1 isoform 3 [Schistosoma japonicum]|uniref:Solute carrier organic anion transporter family member n=1 Tax=Schistosoma japonicum TaxID=6182 RepID=A0A4Z2CQD3_SCHJA|nr:Solute carrier organic anion transporter family member 5A1 isoform 3 [Schistosoma japonicum]
MTSNIPGILKINVTSYGETCDEEYRIPENLKRQGISKTTSEIVDYSLYCGIYKWRPSCLRSSGNIIAFLAAACFISCLQASFSGYTSSQVTTLEKRFAIGSSVIGVINSCFEVGYICSVIYVSYVGSHGRVPLWISVGLFAMSGGAFLWSLPHFIFFDRSRTSYVSLNEQLCILSNNTSTCTEGCDDSLPPSCSESSAIGYAFLPVFIVAQLLIGAGSSPILTLTPPFIDDHVPSSKAPPMIASQYAAAAMGPVIGFALGAFLLRYPADILSMNKPFTMSPGDPEWIGAWWGGFILLGILVFIGGVILLMFPRKLQELPCSDLSKSMKLTVISVPLNNGYALSESTPMRPQNNHINTTLTTDVTADNDSQYQSPWSDFSSSRRSLRRSQNLNFQPLSKLNSKSTWNDFTTVVFSLIRNKIYIMACLCISTEMFIVIGFASFLPKYLEMEFRINKSSSSLIAGGLIVPCGAFGILVGGLILNRFQLRRIGAIRFVIVLNLLILTCICSFLFLGCQNPSIAGLTVPYPDEFIPFSPEVSSQCNTGCSCNKDEWSPVCHLASDTTFISPCYAGCKERFIVNGSLQEFHKCACVLRSTNSSLSSQPYVTTPGECDLHCNTLIPFVVVLTLSLFLTGVIQNPLLMVTMRSVDHSQRAFALGLKFVIVRFLANLPSPVVYGRVIDGACRFWRSECGRIGDCAFVDIRYLNLYMTGLGIVVKGSGLLFYFLLLYFLHRDKSADSASAFNYNTNHDNLTTEPVNLRCEAEDLEAPTVVVLNTRS